MARRRGSAPRIAGRGRTKQKDTPDYYAKSDSDIVYGETAHRRARVDPQRRPSARPAHAG